jgi:hypothetical protein
MVEWATAPTNTVLGPDSGLTNNPPTDPVVAQMCSNQLVRSDGQHQSFSVLGLTLVLILGGIIIILGMVTDTVVGWLQTLLGARYRRTQWILDEKLQLQRAAYEGFGVGGAWEGRMDGVPTTAGVGVLVPSSSDVFLGKAKGEESGK